MKDESDLPLRCKDHPLASVRYEYDQTFMGGCVGQLGSPGEKTIGYYCAECGRELCSPEEYRRRMLVAAKGGE